MASWFPSGVAAPASRPPPQGCNPSRGGASLGRSRSGRSHSPRAPSPDSESAGAMGRGACVPWAALGARAQAGWLGAVLCVLCLLPVLLSLARPGTPGSRPAAGAKQVSSSALCGPTQESGCPHLCVCKQWDRGQPRASSSAHRPGSSRLTYFLVAAKEMLAWEQKTRKCSKTKNGTGKLAAVRPPPS